MCFLSGSFLSTFAGAGNLLRVQAVPLRDTPRRNVKASATIDPDSHVALCVAHKGPEREE